VQAALRRIVNDGERGSDIVGSIRSLVKKGDWSRAQIEPGPATLARGGGWKATAQRVKARL